MVKLYHVGIHPRIISWVESFLRDRSFQVHIRGTLSSVRSAPSGVPQGSVLAPVLFCIYTYDLPHLVEALGVTCKMFADDVKIYKPVANSADTTRIQEAIDAVCNWSCLWGLPLASDKTSVLRLSRSLSHNDYYLGGSVLHNVNQVGDLGFIIDKKLIFDSHCATIAKRAEVKLFQLFRCLYTRILVFSSEPIKYMFAPS